MLEHITNEDFEKACDIFEERAIERIKGREVKIAAYKEEFKKYGRIFFYGAGTDARVIAEHLKDILPGKEVCFIDRNVEKHGKEIVLGIFCKPLETMYGYGDKATIIITTSMYADQIEFDLSGEKYQTEDKLLGTPINTEFCLMMGRNNELRINIKQKEERIEYFKLITDEEARKRMYVGMMNYPCGMGFRNYDKNIFLPVEERGYVDYMTEFLNKHLSDKEGAFICCGYFTGEMIQNVDEASKGAYKKMYDFEMNRLYKAHELDGKLPNDKITVINAGLGEKNYRLDLKKRGVGINSYEWLDYCSDEYCDVKSLDEMVKSGEIAEKITFIRMNFGNGTRFALDGMENVLKRDKPLLAIRPGGHYTMPEEGTEGVVKYLHKIVPEYRFAPIGHREGRLDGGFVLYGYAK